MLRWYRDAAIADVYQTKQGDLGDRFQADVWWEAARGACEDAHLANYAIATGQADATMTGTDQGAVRIDDRVEIGYDDATPDWTFAKFAPDR